MDDYREAIEDVYQLMTKSNNNTKDFMTAILSAKQKYYKYQRINSMKLIAVSKWCNDNAERRINADVYEIIAKYWQVPKVHMYK